MGYAQHKADVIGFFDDYVIKYLLSDLRILSTIRAGSNGEGGCAVPQAISSFAAVDLFGYFLEPTPGIPSLTKMKLKVFLKNDGFFPEFQKIGDLDAFLESFRDDVRSIMTHRFFLVQYHIAKLDVQELFVEKDDEKVFNVSFFTAQVISAIELLYQKIKQDQFVMAGCTTKEETMQRLWERLNALKAYEGQYFAAGSAHITTSSSTTLETTQSLKR